MHVTGMRCGGQGVLLADKADKMDSLNLLRCMAPLSLILLVPATLLLEPDVHSTCLQLMAASPWFLPFLAANAATAYFTNLTNFMVTKHTSALTLQVGAAPAPLGQCWALKNEINQSMQ